MNEAASNLTPSRLKELLHYDPDSGAFTWRSSGQTIRRRCSKHPARLVIDGRAHYAHRLAWLYMTGEWPKLNIDHIDGNYLNNAWANLRDVTQAINMQNRRRPHRNNSSGYLGVSWCNTNKKWVAQIKVNGKHRTIGRFDDPKLAHEAYIETKRSSHQGCTI